jgi:hypothetical protein
MTEEKWSAAVADILLYTFRLPRKRLFTPLWLTSDLAVAVTSEVTA